jgi:hypothetical protein
MAVADGGNSGRHCWQRQWDWLTALMVALLMVAVVDGSGEDGVFSTNSHDNDRHPCSPLEKDC